MSTVKNLLKIPKKEVLLQEIQGIRLIIILYFLIIVINSKHLEIRNNMIILLN